MKRQNTSNSFSETMTWAKPAHGDIALAAAIDDGTMSNASLSANLSDEELHKASLLVDPIENRHFLFRRCFQRIFLRGLLGFTGQTKEIAVLHQLDQRPICLDAPQYQLSFSSSAGATLAAASSSFDVGVDIERIRSIENVAALARRFFTSEEAEFMAALPAQLQNIEFLKSWTAKEAGLKAIGKGIVSGLNTFVRTGDDKLKQEQQDEMPTVWTLEYVDVVPDHMVAVIHRPKENR